MGGGCAVFVFGLSKVFNSKSRHSADFVHQDNSLGRGRHEVDDFKPNSLVRNEGDPSAEKLDTTRHCNTCQPVAQCPTGVHARNSPSSLNPEPHLYIYSYIHIYICMYMYIHICIYVHPSTTENRNQPLTQREQSCFCWGRRTALGESFEGFLQVGWQLHNFWFRGLGLGRRRVVLRA